MQQEQEGIPQVLLDLDKLLVVLHNLVLGDNQQAGTHQVLGLPEDNHQH